MITFIIQQNRFIKYIDQKPTLLGAVQKARKLVRENAEPSSHVRVIYNRNGVIIRIDQTHDGKKWEVAKDFEKPHAKVQSKKRAKVVSSNDALKYPRKTINGSEISLPINEKKENGFVYQECIVKNAGLQWINTKNIV